jgi:hypothetical protein
MSTDVLDVWLADKAGRSSDARVFAVVPLGDCPGGPWGGEKFSRFDVLVPEVAGSVPPGLRVDRAELPEACAVVR